MIRFNEILKSVKFMIAGNPKKGKKVNVKSELKEAEKMLKDLNNNTDNVDRLLESPQREPQTKYARTVPKSNKPSVNNASKQTANLSAKTGSSKQASQTTTRTEPNKAAVTASSPADERAAKDQRYAEALSKWNKPEVKIYESKGTVEEKIIPAQPSEQNPDQKTKQQIKQASTNPTTRKTVNNSGTKIQSSTKPKSQSTTASKPPPNIKFHSVEAQQSSKKPTPSTKTSAASQKSGKPTTQTASKTTTQPANKASAQPSSKTNTKPVHPEQKAAPKPSSVFDQPSSTGAILNKPVDTVSMHSRISVITEESETDVDFYEKLMAKYGIELSDDEDD